MGVWGMSRWVGGRGRGVRAAPMRRRLGQGYHVGELTRDSTDTPGWSGFTRCGHARWCRRLMLVMHLCRVL